MKWILLLCLMMIFVAGCWVNQYVHNTYDPNTGKLTEQIKFDYAKAMVSSKVGSVDINLPDGATLKARSIVLVYDGNDWIKFGKGISAIGLPYMLVP